MDKNFDNTQEWEEMRLSLNALKNKLDKQEIVNDRLLRESMKSKMTWKCPCRWSKHRSDR